MDRSNGYTRVDRQSRIAMEDGDCDGSRINIVSCLCSRKHLISGVALLAISTLLGLLIMLYPKPPTTVHSAPPQGTVLECGNSTTEARAMDCTFDLLTNNWMPRYCSDAETDAEYRAWVLDPSRRLGAFAYFLDNNAERRISSEESLSELVGQDIYTTTENHLSHCAFLARRMHRFVIGEIAAVAHNTLEHTIHCTSAIIDSLEPSVTREGEATGSTFNVGIVSCIVP